MVLYSTCVRFDLIAVWRKERRTYKTWRKFNSTKQGRLDYFLVSADLMADINGAKIDINYRSDHSLVLLSMKKEGIKRDKPFWKFNNSLLGDGKYVLEVKKIITAVKKQYALRIYNHDGIDDIPNEPIELDVSDQLFFEMLLLEIRGKTISYASYTNLKKARKRNGTTRSGSS